MVVSSSIPNSLSEFKHYQALGHGTFAIVYRSLHIESGVEVAVKTVDLNNMLQHQVQQELACLQRVRDLPGVPTLYGCVVDRSNVHIIMELVRGRTLQSILDGIPRSVMSPAALQCIIVQLAATLKGMHQAGVVHRDLKPSNILIARRTGAARLVDFGLAVEHVAKDVDLPGSDSISWAPMKSSDLVHSVLRLGAPLNLRQITSAADEDSVRTVSIGHSGAESSAFRWQTIAASRAGSAAQHGLSAAGSSSHAHSRSRTASGTPLPKLDASRASIAARHIGADSVLHLWRLMTKLSKTLPSERHRNLLVRFWAVQCIPEIDRPFAPLWEVHPSHQRA